MAEPIDGRILKALSGFWYVDTREGLLECRARGVLRLRGVTPLVGDMALVQPLGGGRGNLVDLLPRKNAFVRPACANLDALVILASAAKPVTDPFLLDRMIAIAELKDCEPVLCFHKCDLMRADELVRTYRAAGFTVVETSSATGEGISLLREVLRGKLCAFTGNSGVGKSSLLNALRRDLDLATGEISRKLGRGRHTTRHVELFSLGDGILAADTPGFAAFETEDVTLELKKRLPELFREFRPYLGSCRYSDCSHVRDAGCAVTEALEAGKIARSRHESYVRMHEELRKVEEWSLRD
jgi:ribosome biogenesis GTPase